MKTTFRNVRLLLVVLAVLAGGLVSRVPPSAAARGEALVTVHSYRSGQSVSMAVEAAELSSWGLSFSTRVGGEGTEYGMGMASDPAGNGCVVGFTAASDFPGASGTGTDRDVVVLGYSPNGGPRYVTRIGGAATDNGYGIRHFADGSVVIVGHTQSSDFPVPGAVQPTKGGGFDGFVARLDPDGALAWATFLGGGSYEALSGVSVDPAGNIVAVGQTSSVALAVKQPIQATYQGGERDVMVAGLTPDGGQLRFLSYLGGSGTDAAFADWALADGSVVLGGMTSSADFPTTASAVQPSYNGGNDTFIVRITPAGQLAWSTYLGGSAEDRINGVGADALGRPCVAGKTLSPDYPTESAVQPVKKAGFDEYVTCLDTSGTDIRWSTFLGSSGADYAGGIAVEPTGGVWIAGGAYQGDFPLVGATQENWAGKADATVSRFSDTGALTFSTFWGGADVDGGYSIAIDSAGGAWMSGKAGAAPTPFVAAPTTPPDGFDMAVTHFTGSAEPPPEDAVPPAATVTVPTMDQVFTALPVVLSGTATDNVGVDRVAVAIRDQATNLWLQADGTYGSWTTRLRDANLADPGATSTAWTFTFDPGRDGLFGIQVLAWDAAGNLSPALWRRFEIAAAPPPPEDAAFVTIMVGRAQWVATGTDCQPLAGAVPLDRTAEDLRDLGVAATLAPIVARTQESQRLCMGSTSCMRVGMILQTCATPLGGRSSAAG